MWRFSKRSFDDFSLQASIELLKLIDNEMQKASKMQKKGSDCKAQALESIIQKALKTPSIYGEADMKKLKPYLESALTATECDRYINQVASILSTCENAKTAIAEMYLLSDEKSLDVDFAIQALAEPFNTSFRSCVQTAKMTSYAIDFEEFITELVLNPRNVNVPESFAGLKLSDREQIEDVLAKGELTAQDIDRIVKGAKTETIKRIERTANDYTETVSTLNKILKMVKAYDEKYLQTQKTLVEIVQQKIAGRESLITGKILGKVDIMNMDEESGEVTSLEKGENERQITDTDLLQLMYTKLIKHANFLMAEIKSLSSESTNYDTLKDVIYRGYNTIEEWTNNFDSDFQKLIAFYDQALEYDKKISSISYELRSANKKFVSNFNPRGGASGLRYFDDESLQLFRKYGRDAMEFEAQIKDRFYPQLSNIFASSILLYFNNLSINEGMGRSIEKSLDLKSVGNIESIPSLYEDGDEIPVMTEVEKHYDTIKALSINGISEQDIVAMLSNKKLRMGLRALVPFMSYELSFCAIKNMIKIEMLHDEGKSVEALKMVPLVADTIDSMQRVKTDGEEFKGMFMCDAFYKYLEERMPEFGGYLAKSEMFLKERAKRRMDTNPAVFTMLNECRKVYDSWETAFSEYSQKGGIKERNEAFLKEYDMLESETHVQGEDE